MSSVIHTGDAFTVMRTMQAESIDCIVTSPPYYRLRDYGCEGQLGLEESPEEYIDKLREIFAEARRVLKDEGTLWLNLGDGYYGSGKGASTNRKSAEGTLQGTNKGTVNCPKVTLRGVKGRAKNLMGIPWKAAFALQDDGWNLRQDIIWHKPNSMPESVTDRCTRCHEYIFLFSKNLKYYFDAAAIKEKANTYDMKLRDRTNARLNSVQGRRKIQGLERGDYKFRNKRDVWTVSNTHYTGAHYAVFPKELVRPCIRAGCPEGGTVLDPFCGSGTVGLVCKEESRNFVGIDINPKYVKIAESRLTGG